MATRIFLYILDHLKELLHSPCMMSMWHLFRVGCVMSVTCDEKEMQSCIVASAENSILSFESRRFMRKRMHI